MYTTSLERKTYKQPTATSYSPAIHQSFYVANYAISEARVGCTRTPCRLCLARWLPQGCSRRPWLMIETLRWRWLYRQFCWRWKWHRARYKYRKKKEKLNKFTWPDISLYTRDKRANKLPVQPNLEFYFHTPKTGNDLRKVLGSSVFVGADVHNL